MFPNDAPTVDDEAITNRTAMQTPPNATSAKHASSPVVSDASDSEEEEDNAANGSEYFPSFNDTSLE
ncbi:hypothetical protein MTO96_037021 [Rhipicephalus appendiculatus]